MYFRFKDVKLEWQSDKGYRHPKTGTWVAETKDCLGGWLEPDPDKRRQWAELIALIQDFWIRQAELEVPLGEELIFG